MREALGKVTSASSTASTQTVPHWITSFSAGTPMSTRVSSEPIIARERALGFKNVETQLQTGAKSGPGLKPIFAADFFREPKGSLPRTEAPGLPPLRDSAFGLKLQGFHLFSGSQGRYMCR